MISVNSILHTSLNGQINTDIMNYTEADLVKLPNSCHNGLSYLRAEYAVKQTSITLARWRVNRSLCFDAKLMHIAYKCIPICISNVLGSCRPMMSRV